MNQSPLQKSLETNRSHFMPSTVENSFLNQFDCHKNNSKANMTTFFLRQHLDNLKYPGDSGFEEIKKIEESGNINALFENFRTQLKNNSKLDSGLFQQVCQQKNLKSQTREEIKPTQQMPRRKNASRETTCVLKAWLNEHRKNPYPTKGEKIMLAIITKMSLTQVSTWFANARRRLKKENKMTWIPRNRSEDDDLDDDLDDSLDLDDLEEDQGILNQIDTHSNVAINFLKRPRETSLPFPLEFEDKVKKMKIWSLLEGYDNSRTNLASSQTTDSLTELSSTSSSSPGQLTRSMTPPSRSLEFPKDHTSPTLDKTEINAASFIKSTFLSISREGSTHCNSKPNEILSNSPYLRCIQALAITAASLAQGVEKGHSIDSIVNIPKPLGFYKFYENDTKPNSAQ